MKAYQVWIKDGIDLEVFGTEQAAELYIDLYIEKRAKRSRRMSRNEFEIRIVNDYYIESECDF